MSSDNTSLDNGEPEEKGHPRRPNADNNEAPFKEARPDETVLVYEPADSSVMESLPATVEDIERSGKEPGPSGDDALPDGTGSPPPGQGGTGSGDNGEGGGAAKPKREGLGRTFGLVALLSFLSKFFGLARDIVVLGAFGAAADAYNYAFLFTGNILVLFGGIGGPFHSTTVSILAARKEKEDIRELIGQILLFSFFSLSFIGAIMWIFAPQLISFVLPGTELTPEARVKLWADVLPQLRTMIPLVLIAGLVGIGAGISNIYKEYGWPSVAPAVLSVAVIVAVFGWSSTAGVMCLAVGTLAGALGQLAVQLPGMAKSKPKFSLSLKAQPGLKAFLLMLGPAAIATEIGQLNLYIDGSFVSSLPQGSMTAITNANRLIQLPLGVLLTAMLVPILPRFTEQAAAKEFDELKETFRKGLRIVWFLVLPMAAILLAIPGPIVQLLFERGRFDETMRLAVVTALVFLVPMIFFYVPRDLLTRAFYAQQDAKTPLLVGLTSIGIKYCANIILVTHMGLGIAGITGSTTVITIVNMTLLAYFLRKRIGALGITKLIRPALIMLAASVACGFTAYYVQAFVISFVQLSGSFGKFANLAVSLVVSGSLALAAYCGICIAFKLEEPKVAFERVKRKPGKK